MLRTLIIKPESLPLRTPFRISRGVKTATEVVVVELHEEGLVGRGECVPYPRYGESCANVIAQLQPLEARIAAGEPFDNLAGYLPAGAARNALDCAIWDLLARRTGQTVAERLGREHPASLAAAITIGLDSVGAMRAAAQQAAGSPIIKVKLDADDAPARFEAVAEAAQGSQFIIDPNESWNIATLRQMESVVARYRVMMVEQPLPADADEDLRDLDYPAPICADEAVHTTDDLDAIGDKYSVVNIKLDKTGGLTEALRLQAAARAGGFQVMTGCMICSSLSIAPALFIASASDFADLDGPWWLAQDRDGGCRFENGMILPPRPGFWGDLGMKGEAE
ncbi:N-acetyl-D-Glu racemase DgcA [Qipengyuania sp. ASV99]|uniref:N-acetyl-D-Glu racemase DgcA n=1 Tax=Qipengyuania sp. ASV99 TaxID=3399681 RepID=UPI003A4C6BA8